MNRSPFGNERRFSPPPFWISLTLCVGICGIISWLRLTVYHDRVFPLTNALPLLLCLWNRDLRLLYGMSLLFTFVSLVKVFWAMPGRLNDHLYVSVIIASQMANIWVVAFAIHGLIRAQEKLERKNGQLDQLNSELAASNEELAAREEEITRQNEELQSQAEELEQQTEDLRQQTEETELKSAELHELNLELMRKERGMKTLLESGRWLRSDMNESFVMNGICQAVVQVFGDSVHAAAVAADQQDKLVLKGDFGFGLQSGQRAGIAFHESFTSRIIECGRTACIEDMDLRPDLKLPPPATGPPFKAVIASPIWVDGESRGALEVYSAVSTQWTEHDFRIIEWFAGQVSLALQAISAQNEVESKRRDAEEASRQKTRFLAAVSHDVRTPANAISLLAEFIQKSAADPARVDQIPGLAKNLWSNARAMVDLVSGVLDITRFDSGNPELDISEFSLCELLRSEFRQAQPHAESKGLKLICELPAQDVWIASDRMKLGRVFSNLLSNAVKFTESGEVKLSLLASGEGGHLVQVIDSGIGIPQEHLGSVFDEFFQLRNPERNREKGAGLGLAICHRLLNSLDLRIRVSSVLGLGSTFTVEIPEKHLVNPGASLILTDSPRYPGDVNLLDGLRILLVEDHDIARDVTAGLLAAEGALVCKAANGREALRLLSSGQHRLLLLDLNLPDFDGREILMSLQQQSPKHLQWILVVSGDVRPERIAEVKQLGAHIMLPKPICIDKIHAALRQLGGKMANA